MDFTDFHEMQNLLIAHAYYYQFGNIRVASKTCDKHFRLDAADIVLLSQLIYWTSYSTKEKEYWVYKTREELSKETMLSPKQIDRAREDLVAIGLLYYKVAGYPPTTYYKINFDRFIEYAKALTDAKDNKDPVVYISAERLDELEKIREVEDVSPPIPGLGKGKSTRGGDVEVPEDWFPVFAQIRECGFYRDKADRDPRGNVYGYNQNLYLYLTEILNGTFYDNSGKNITTRHDLTGLTKEQILEWITKENRIPAGGTDYAHRAIVYTTSKATYSPMLNALCGKGTTPVKTKKLPEADPPKEAPMWLFGNTYLASLYPDIEQDDKHFWAFYLAAIEYAEDCQVKKGDDRTKWGMWTRQNNGVTTLPNNFLLDIFRAAKGAEMSVEEIYSLKFGDVNNFLWILTAREMKHNHSIKILPDGKDYSYVYGDGPLNRSKYERR